MKNKFNSKLSKIWLVLFLVFATVNINAATLQDRQAPDGTPPTIKSGGLIIEQGNVGIGATTPSEALHVVGSVKIAGSGTLIFNDDSILNTAPTFLGLPDTFGSYSSFAGYYLRVNNTEDGIELVESALTAPGAANQVVKSDGAGNFEGAGLYSDSTGVGIGTSSPTMRLDVAGGIRRSLHVHGAQTTSFTMNAATNEHSVSISADISLTLNNLLSGATSTLYVTNTGATTSFVSIPTSYENGNSKSSFAVPPGKETIASFFIANGSTNIVLSGEYINFTESASAPTSGDDEDDGYTKGSIWRNTTNDDIYILADPTVASAVWKLTSQPTTVYTKPLTIQNPEAAQEFSFFYTPVDITISELVIVLLGSATPSVTVDIHHSTDRSAAGNALITTPSATTSTTTGSVITSFDDATIPANSFVWVEIDAQSGTVDECFISVEYTKD